MRRRLRTLLLHCLRHDVIDSAATGSSPLLSGILFSSLVGFVVAGVAVGGSARGTTAIAFALLGIFGVVDALGDVASAWLDPRDLPLLRAMPTAPGEYARARLAALLLPVVSKALALILPTGCVLVARGELRAAAAMVVAFELLALLLAGGAVLLLLWLRRVAPRMGLREVVVWTRSLLLVTATGGWLALPAAAGAAAAEWCAVAWLPTTWFSELAIAAAGGEPVRLGLVGIAFAALLLLALAIARAVRHYLPMLEALAAAPPPARRRRASWLRSAFERRFVAAAERPSFRLALRLLRRERSFRLQSLPLLAYPLLFLVLGRGQDDHGLFGLLFAQLPALVLALASMLLQFSDSPAGGFFLRFYGAECASAVELGARKAFWYGTALPLSLLVALLLGYDRGLLYGAAVGAVGLLSSTVALLLVRPPSAVLPFVERFRGRLDGGEGGRVFGLLFLVIGGALLEWRLLVAGAAPTGGLLAAALAATVVLLRRPAPVQSGSALGAWTTLDPDAATGGGGPRVPFTRRLRREICGLAAFFVAAGGVLTAFYAWF